MTVWLLIFFLLSLWWWCVPGSRGCGWCLVAAMNTGCCHCWQCVTAMNSRPELEPECPTVTGAEAPAWCAHCGHWHEAVQLLLRHSMGREERGREGHDAMTSWHTLPVTPTHWPLFSSTRGQESHEVWWGQVSGLVWCGTARRNTRTGDKHKQRKIENKVHRIEWNVS